MKLVKLWSEPPQAEPVEFRSGLNLVVARQTKQVPSEEPNEKKTTNGVGKTTFAKALDFCLLADSGDIPFTQNPKLQHLTFCLEIEDRGKTYIIKRSLRNPNRPTLIHSDGVWQEYKLSDLRNLFTDWFLGRSNTGKDHPSFRQVMNYLIRDEKEGYFSPFESFRKANSLNVNTMTLYLMDLDYSFPRRIDELAKERERLENTIAGLQSTLTEEGFSAKAALVAQRAEIARELEMREAELRQFRVLPEYRELQHELSDLARRMQQLRNRNFQDQRRLDDYERLLQAEPVTVNVDAAIQVYEDLSVNFPQVLRKGLQDIIDFQQSVARAERRFTEREIKGLREKIEARTETIQESDKRRSEITARLAEFGALDEYQRLSGLLANLREKLASFDAYRRMFERLEEAEINLSKVKQAEEELRLDIRQALKDSEQRLLEINMLFSKAFRAMYGHGAYLSVEFPKKAFSLKRTAEEGEEFESLGKNHASIFCYDIALLLENADRHPFPHFVVHDGVFTGVDPRQVQSALQFILEHLNGPELQYICTLNESEITDVTDYVDYIRLRLTDTGPEGKYLKDQF